jgi:uncharacterized protein
MEIKRSAAGAVLIFALGFVLGVNSERLEQSVTDRTPALGFAASLPDTGAAYASYEKGDHATALRLARPLAEQGDARAQSLLGSIYYSGRGVPRDDLEATKWFSLAADQGDAAAQFRLGLMYSEGHGMPQDHAEAAEWYQRAANERYAQAQYNLGLLNLAAVHFPASDTRNRNAALNSRDVVARKLTREQLAEAQKLAREWKPVRLAQHGGGTS